MTPPVRENLDRDLKFAIANKRLLRLTYKTQSRVVEPHDYGRYQGVVRLLVYQIEGMSTSRGPGWRDLEVAKIEACTVLERTFPGSRGSGYQRHKKWDELYARVP